MKTFKHISKAALMALMLSCGATSCNYLDVVPPEQANLSDATADAEKTLGFLYSCYAGVNSTSPTASYSGTEASADEWVLPEIWNEGSQKISWDINSATNLTSWVWGETYRFVGQCYLFLQQLPGARGVTEQERREWTAEANFLIAYYHMYTLLLYGPCPITDQYIPQDTPSDMYPGRSHFDYVVEWICNKFDEVCESGDLPATREGSAWGRATTVMAKALKARLLLYAASPLWNGDFPYKDWKNVNYETPGYGKELVSLKYDPNKWTKALAACEDAIDHAEKNGHKLFTLEDSEALRSQQQIALPYVPFKNENGSNAAADSEFMKHVILMRYVTATRTTEGNREILWGLANQGSMQIGSLPHRTQKQQNGQWFDTYGGVSPTLNSLNMFYSENGKPIDQDPEFWSESEWYQRAGIGGSDIELKLNSGNKIISVDKQRELRGDIIKLNTRREPRFYAWFAFDGGDFGSKVLGGVPLIINVKDSESHGYDIAAFPKNNNVTGYFSQKYFPPMYQYDNTGATAESKPRPMIRLAELYLAKAECLAALGRDGEALEAMNPVRNRAGIPELTTADLSGTMTATDWVRNERSVELWGEGFRYYDVRRWMIARKTLGAGVRYGLNAEVKDPSFEVFNTPTVINQQFKWTDRMYLFPVFYNEVYKNPQMIQAPEY